MLEFQGMIYYYYKFFETLNNKITFFIFTTLQRILSKYLITGCLSTIFTKQDYNYK